MILYKERTWIVCNVDKELGLPDKASVTRMVAGRRAALISFGGEC